MNLPILLLIWITTAASAGGDLPSDLTQYLATVSERGVPAHVVELKAREGLSKGVPMERLQPILERLVYHLETAREIHEDADDELLSATAGALRAGASVSAIQTISEVETSSPVRAIETLADLLRMKFNERDALRLTKQAARAPDANAALIGVSGAAGALVRAGMPAPMAAQQIDMAMDTSGDMRDDVASPRGKAYGHDKGAGPADPKGKDK